MSAASPILFRLISVEYSAAAYGAQILLSTDLPGDGSMAVRETITLPQTNGRAVLPPTPLQGTTKGRIFNVETFAPASSALVVYRIGFYLRHIGRTPSEWSWHWISVPGTGDEWQTVPVPIPQTPEAWIEVKAPVPPTPEEWAMVPTIPSTSTEQHTVALPMDE